VKCSPSVDEVDDFLYGSFGMSDSGLLLEEVSVGLVGGIVLVDLVQTRKALGLGRGDSGSERKGLDLGGSLFQIEELVGDKVVVGAV